MCIFSMARLAIAVATLTVAMFTGAAYANESVTEAGVADSLLPLETADMEVQADADLFQSVADDINETDSEAAETTDLADVLGAGFLEGLVDEDGEVNLPLGITVFDAMGTTSVGFGGSF